MMAIICIIEDTSSECFLPIVLKHSTKLKCRRGYTKFVAKFIRNKSCWSRDSAISTVEDDKLVEWLLGKGYDTVYSFYTERLRWEGERNPNDILTIETKKLLTLPVLSAMEEQTAQSSQELRSA